MTTSTTSINDYQFDDHLFEKMENQTNSRIFRPWDNCAINETTKSTMENCLKDLKDLKDKEMNKNFFKSTSFLSNRLPSDFFLTEMFSASCTMNQNSLSAMESIYNQLYRDYFSNSKNSICNNDLNFLNTLNANNKLTKLNKFVNDCKLTNLNDLTTSKDLLSNHSNGLITNKLLSNNCLSRNGLLPSLSSSSTNLVNTNKNLIEQTTSNSKLSTIDESNSSVNDLKSTTLTNQLPVNLKNISTKTNINNTTICNKIIDTNRFSSSSFNDKNQTKKPRPKRFRCHHCPQAFSNNGQLKGHIRVHTGKYQILEIE